jgi:hypothetical protein
MDMIIHSDPETRDVNDYDFTFVGGILLPVTIDEKAGDSIEVDPLYTKIHLSSKPSPGNPMAILPAEDLTIYNSQLLSVQHRVRQVTLLTEEQKFEWNKVLKTLGTVQ